MKYPPRIWPIVAPITLALWMTACGADPRDPVPDDSRWSEPPTTTAPQDPIAFADRADGNAYGLPKTGLASVQQIIDLFDTMPDRSDILVSDGFAPIGFEECSVFSNVETSPELPMVIEAVITLHPRQFIKPAVCGQDERHYGSFVIEDDTAGIVVLRDSRVATFSYGDRVRMTVRGIMRTFGPDADTRAVLVQEVELAPQRIIEVDGQEQIDRTVLYQTTEQNFSEANVARVHRVEGWVHQPPTNANFSSMILTDRPIDPAAGDRAVSSGPTFQCQEICQGANGCRRNCDDLLTCADICVELCEQAAEDVEPGEAVDPPAVEDIPVCWFVGLDVELGRRGFSPEQGKHVRATGPVVNDFDRQIWVGSTGQIEFLDD